MITIFSVTEVRKACEVLLGTVKSSVPKPNEFIAKILGE
jgi:hypothetical protein